MAGDGAGMADPVSGLGDALGSLLTWISREPGSTGNV